MQRDGVGLRGRRWGVLLMLALLAADAAAEGEPRADDFNPLVAVALFEGVVAANAWMASQEPQIYGGVALLLFPVAVAETDHDAMFWVGLVGAESLALYNLTLDRDRYGKPEIFRNNLIGWHLFAGALGMAAWLSADDEQGRASITVAPTPQGAELRVAYRF